MVPETIRDGRETVGDISGGKGAGLRSPSPVVIFIGEGGGEHVMLRGWRWDDMMTSDQDVYSF